MADIAEPIPRFFLGLRTDIQGNIHHLSNNDVLYPVGSVLAKHDFLMRQQQFIRLPEKGYNVNIITVSADK